MHERSVSTEEKRTDGRERSDFAEGENKYGEKMGNLMERNDRREPRPAPWKPRRCGRRNRFTDSFLCHPPIDYLELSRFRAFRLLQHRPLEVCCGRFVRRPRSSWPESSGFWGRFSLQEWSKANLLGSEDAKAIGNSGAPVRAGQTATAVRSLAAGTNCIIKSEVLQRPDVAFDPKVQDRQVPSVRRGPGESRGIALTFLQDARVTL